MEQCNGYDCYVFHRQGESHSLWVLTLMTFSCRLHRKKVKSRHEANTHFLECQQEKQARSRALEKLKQEQLQANKTVTTLGWAYPTVSAIPHPFSELHLLLLFIIFFLPVPCLSIFLIISHMCAYLVRLKYLLPSNTEKEETRFACGCMCWCVYVHADLKISSSKCMKEIISGKHEKRSALYVIN